ncbi:hypothetical protein MKEN_00357000 [Mycena kentingensis (nom. inval.)]|nr:hypothetical protein MKEN_00357000 [Mycena kentingensis (nom. inval.)]
MPPVPEASDEIVETDLPAMVSFHGRRASLDCKFIFSAPRQLDPKPTLSFPQAQSTPTPPFAPNNAAAEIAAAAPPSTDPRLRLFQFQYDTFTRDHLSALADSIAVNAVCWDSRAVGSPTAIARIRGELLGLAEHETRQAQSARRLRERRGGWGDSRVSQKLWEGVRRRVAVAYGDDQAGARRLKFRPFRPSPARTRAEIPQEGKRNPMLMTIYAAHLYMYIIDIFRQIFFWGHAQL